MRNSVRTFSIGTWNAPLWMIVTSIAVNAPLIAEMLREKIFSGTEGEGYNKEALVMNNMVVQQ
jgi:hypothetical protein